MHQNFGQPGGIPIFDLKIGYFSAFLDFSTGRDGSDRVRVDAYVIKNYPHQVSCNGCNTGHYNSQSWNKDPNSIYITVGATSFEVNSTKLLTTIYTSCDQSDVELELEYNNFDYMESSIIKCDQLKGSEGLDCQVACMPGYTMDQKIDTSYSFFLECKSLNLAFNGQSGEPLTNSQGENVFLWKIRKLTGMDKYNSLSTSKSEDFILSGNLPVCKRLECPKNFHYDSGLCKPNICSCQNGDPKIGTDCLNHEKEDCIHSSCHAGFHYTSGSDSNICEQNVCTCQNGQPKEAGIDCLVHGQEDCISSRCDTGFHFVSGICKSINICGKIIDNMLKTAVFDDTVFDVKKEGGNREGIRIKKLSNGWKAVSFPKSQDITSFEVINLSGSDYLAPYFSNTPYTGETGYPKDTIGSESHYENKFPTIGSSGDTGRTGIPKWNNKNDSSTITKRSKFIDLGFTTSSGNLTFTIDPSQLMNHGTYDVENMTPIVEMYSKDTEILITNVKDAGNPFC